MGGGIEYDFAVVQANDSIAAGQRQRSIVQGDYGTVMAGQRQGQQGKALMFVQAGYRFIGQ